MKLNNTDMLEDIIQDFEERIKYELDQLEVKDMEEAIEEHDTAHELSDELGIDIYDIIHSCADENVPLYRGDLIELAKEYPDLMTDEPELGPAFGGEPTPLNLLAANVFEWIVEGLNEWVGDGYFNSLVKDYVELHKSYDVGGPSYANYHRDKEGK
tara:strand:+ start:983 stop:1450 length:468 start_codon:yes stop_codon:yes gene_type:complete